VERSSPSKQAKELPPKNKRRTTWGEALETPPTRKKKGGVWSGETVRVEIGQQGRKKGGKARPIQAAALSAGKQQEKRFTCCRKEPKQRLQGPKRGPSKPNPQIGLVLGGKDWEAITTRGKDRRRRRKKERAR